MAISQYWTSNIQGVQRKVKREPPRTTAERIFPIASRPLAISTSALGDLLFEVGLDDPRRQVVALADVGGEDQDPRLALLASGEAPASSAPAACSLPFSEGRLPGTGSGGRVVQRTHSTYLRTPSLKLVSAFQPSSSSARSLEIALPGKSPGRGGVWTISQLSVFSCTRSAISRIVTISSPERL